MTLFSSQSPSAGLQPVTLFLDFDGVLHHHLPATDPSRAPFCFLPAFEAAVRASPRPVEIVITSSWRREHSLDSLRANFSPDIAARIVGATPRVGEGTGLGARLAEVRAWLQENDRHAAPWVAVDDYPELFAPGVAVVVCHDCFAEREAALLALALADPEVFAKTHPVPDYSAGRKLVLPPFGAGA